MPTIQVRRGTAAAWLSANPVLASGEPGFETDTGLFKYGNGTSSWSTLPYGVRDATLPSYAPAQLKNNWISSLSGYNSNQRTTRKAKAQAKKLLGGNITHYHALAYGDSIFVGYNGASYQYEYSVPRQMGKTLAKTFGVEHTSGLQAASLSTNAVPDNVTLSGNWTLAGSVYPHFFTGSGAGSYTWRSMDPCTSVEFYISNQSGTGLSYSVDGAASVSLSFDGTATVKKISAASGLTKGHHTITISGITSGQMAFIVAFRGWDPLVAQLETHNLAIGGSKANSPGQPNANWSDSTTTANGAGLAYLMNSVWSLSGIGTPDLFIVSAGNNDHAGGTATSAIIQGLTTMRGYYPNTPALFIRPPRVANSDNTSFIALCTASYQFADSQDVILYDWNDAAQGRDNAQSDGLLGPDNNHPINGEQVSVGRTIAELWNFPWTVSSDLVNGIYTATFTVIGRWNCWYRCSGSFTFYLPIAPDNGTFVKVENTSTGAITVTRLGTNLIEGATTNTVAAGDTCVYTYTDGTWTMNRSTSLSIAGTDVRRNAAGQIEAEAPTSGKHLANKTFVDSGVMSTPAGPVGSAALVHPPRVNALTQNSLSASNLGFTSFFEFYVGANGLALRGMAIQVGAVAVGGTSVQMKCGIYADDGYGSPLISSAALVGSVTYNITATGIRITAFSSVLNLTRGRWWMGTFFYYTAAPTTFPQVNTATGIGSPLWSASGTYQLNRYLRTAAATTDLPIAGQALTPLADALGIVSAAQVN